MQGQCDCCFLVRNDTTFKEVVFCEQCNANICKECDRNWFKRGVAYFLRKLGKEVKPVVNKDCNTC